VDKLFVVSPSPHNKSDISTDKLMFGVIVALLPAFLVSIAFFGLGALTITATAVASCVVFEYLIQRFILKGKRTICDFSAVLSGLLLAFNVPSILPLWMVVVGSFVTIAIAKMSYGGIGRNVFNPALVGRVFLLICFPVEMTLWPKPTLWNFSPVDAETGATVLGFIKEGVKKGMSASDVVANLPSYGQMFMGQMGGCIGEVSAFALIAGGLYMLARKIITWHIPVCYIGTVAIFTTIMWKVNPDLYVNPMIHLLSGGLMLGAFFMATDYVTSPMTAKGKILFGVSCGLLTCVIRFFGAYPEGVSFAILIMNACVPLIDRWFTPRAFGTGR